MKTCNQCAKTKKLTKFPLDRKSPDGYSTICKECKNKRRRLVLRGVAIKKKERGQAGPIEVDEEFIVSTPPEVLRPVEDLLKERKRRLEHTKQAYAARHLIPVKIKLPGPIGICVFGDPHIDSDHCDIDLIERHTDIVSKTEGFFGANIGDTTNNWMGRLARLYGEQSTSAAEAWQLAEWFLKRVPWLFVLGGNHDCVDEETEALTQRGWLKYDQVTTADKAFGINRLTGKGEWMPIERVIVKKTDRQMKRVVTEQLDLHCTETHRVLYKRRDWKRKFGDLDLCELNKVTKGRIAIPTAAPSSEAGTELNNAQIQLTGWVLTDGSIQRVGDRVGIHLYQSKPTAPITSLLDKLGYTYTVATQGRKIESIGNTALKSCLPQSVIQVSAESSQRIVKYVDKKDCLPDWVWDMNDKQFEVFLSALIAGDGCWHNHGKPSLASLYGKKELLDQVQALATTHGWSAIMSATSGKDFRLNLKKRDWASLDLKAKLEDSEYADTVWCLTVPHSNFLVRRNGRPHFTGNCWSGAGDPIKWILRECHGVYEMHGIRIELRFPNGLKIRMNARHDFAGSSQWNPAHGAMKAAQMGWRDHILICGHKHRSGYGVLKDPASGITNHCIQVASYKLPSDEFARAKGFPDQHISPCASVIIDPDCENEASKIHLFWDPEEAAEFLNWKRKKFKKG